MRASETGEVAAWCLRFYPDQFNGLLNHHEQSAIKQAPAHSNRLRFYHAGSQIAQQFGALAARAQQQNPTVDHWHAVELVAAILGEEFSNLDRNGEAAPAPASRLPELLARIGFDEFQRLSVEDLARKFGYSRRHLSRLFHELYGRSVVSYKIELRLEKAAAMLASSEAKIIHVAMECGFGHLGLFSAKFKERFGASPGQWRRKVCSEGISPNAPRNNDIEKILSSGTGHGQSRGPADK
ncbi:MAG: helix-turn-helix transcriptional regulator [Verrucomicrobiales bacterium]|nr:helix-turn-helix transcriptional regulator [Verrucomicrobiales bacterium]